MKNFEKNAALLGIRLIPDQMEKFNIFLAELRDWNQRLNLTSITDYDDVLRYHFLDSLTVKLAFTEGNACIGSIIDVGSGGGFPGMPLAIVFPSVQVCLLEATRKKTEFLHHIRDILQLENVSIVNERAETAAHNSGHREHYDVAVARALAPLATLAELMLPFCKTGGLMVAQKKGNIESEITACADAAAKLGGETPRIVPVELAELADNRCLVVVNKSKPSPDNYPRRPGIPTKRPL